MEFNHCYGCMRELSAPGAVCPHCGYDNTNDPNNPSKQPSHALPCGTVLKGRFITGRILGHSSFDFTYIGYDLILENFVCIKEYFPSNYVRSPAQQCTVLWVDGDERQNLWSFILAAQKVARLRDLCHIVTVWDVFRENETAYIVMDYLAGETMRKRLNRTQKTLSEKDCIALLTPVMDDLSQAHERGIIHCGVRPENLMVLPDGQLILKLGTLSTSYRIYDDPDLDFIFNRPFAEKAIEQYVMKGEIGPWTDVYGMCATIYHCVSGKALTTAIDRVAGATIDLSCVSPAVGQTLREGLAVMPKDRIWSMRELCQKLQSAVSNEENDKLQPPITVYVPHGLKSFSGETDE